MRQMAIFIFLFISSGCSELGRELGNFEVKEILQAAGFESVEILEVRRETHELFKVVYNSQRSSPTTRTIVKAEAKGVWEGGRWQVRDFVPLAQTMQFTAPTVVLVRANK